MTAVRAAKTRLQQMRPVIKSAGGKLPLQGPQSKSEGNAPKSFIDRNH